MTRLIGEAYIALLADASLFRTDADAKIKAALGGIKPKIPITADMGDVDKKISALAAALKGLNGEAQIELDTRGAIRDVAALEAAIVGLWDRLDNIPVDLDDSKSLAKLYTLIGGADDLAKRLETLGADVDITKALAKFYALEAGAKTLEESVAHIDPELDITVALAKIDALKGNVGVLGDELSSLRASVTSTAALAKIVALQAQALKLARELQNMPVTADTLPFEASMFKISAQVEALKKTLDLPVENNFPLAFVAKLPSFGQPSAYTQNEAMMMDELANRTMDAMLAFEKLSKAEEDVNTLSPLLAAGLQKIANTQSMIIQGGAGGWWGFMSNKIRLFGGALDSIMPAWARAISVWHLAADLIFEFAAAWVPALIAVGTFAAYAVPVGEKIIGQWKNINTILDGVGGKLPDLGTSFDTIERAIEPSLLEAFGEYMMVIGHNAVPMGDALAKLGSIIDVWGANLVDWADKAQKSFDNILRSGSTDFAEIGYGFQQLIRIISELIKDMPGIVHVLLPVGDAILTVIADVVQAFGPVIKFGLLIHGVMIYAGLAVTALVALGRAMAAGAIAAFATRMGTAVGETGTVVEETSGKFTQFGLAIGAFGGTIAAGVTKAAKYGRAVFDLGRTEGVAKAGALVLGDAVGAIPFGVAGLAALGVAAAVGTVLYFAFRHTTDAADEFNAKIQTLIASSNVANIAKNIASALAQTTRQMQMLSAVTKDVNTSLAGTAAEGSVYAQKLNSDLNAENAKYLAGVTKIVNANDTYGERLETLSKIFGSTGAAQAALNLAGIQAGTIATENNAKWHTTLTELKALAAGYGYMGQQAGQAGNQLDTLNIASGTTMKNVQALTQAEGAWITLISSGDSAFTGFEQGQATLNKTMKEGAKSGATLTVRLGNLREAYPLLGTSLRGTTASALAARQAFDQQLAAGTTLYGNLQTLATASGDTAKAQHELFMSGKDIVGQLLPLAAGSKEATAEVYALAQVAGYSGRDSFASLAKWVGHTRGAEADLNKEQAALTISSAKLSTAAKNLGNALETEVTQAQAAAIAKTANLTGATQKLAAIANSARGQISQAAVTFSGEYVTALTKTGIGTTKATQYLNAYLHQLGYSNVVIKAIDESLGGATSQWNTYDAAVARNTQVAQANAKATAANMAAYQGLYDVLPGTGKQLMGVWASLVKQDAAMVKSGNDAAGAKNQFTGFAVNGLNLTRNQADMLWAKFGQQNLDTLASKAASTKQSFIQFAMNGLKLTSNQAQTLWGEFTQQNLDMLITKGDNAKGKFIELARKGLDLTTFEAQNLWNTLRQQYLDTLAGKAGETRQAFEKTASQLGVTRQQADKLWSSLHRLVADSPYNAKETTVFSGFGGVNAKVQIPGDPGVNARLAFQGLGFAGGGVVPGASSNGHDNHLAMVKSGELIIPSSHAARFLPSAKQMGIPGFASGGFVGNEVANINNIIPFGAQAGDKFAQGVGQVFINSLKKAVTAMATGPGSGPLGGITGSAMSNGMELYNYLLHYLFGGNKIAAAGATASIWGESGWNPYAVGTGGRGLIGWTPPGKISDSVFRGGMSTQLPAIIQFVALNGDWGVINAMKGASSVSEAAWLWGRGVERFGIPDVHPEGIALATSFMNSGGVKAAQSTASVLGRTSKVRPHSAGGTVNEPVYGTGAWSGIPYSFAENGGPEAIVPGGMAHSGTASGMPGATTYQAATTNQLLGMMVKLLQQMPYAYARAVNNGAAKGVHHAYYGAQG